MKNETYRPYISDPDSSIRKRIKALSQQEGFKQGTIELMIFSRGLDGIEKAMSSKKKGK
jgi:hypothetical protein